MTRRSVTAKTLTGPGPDRETLVKILTAAARVPDHGKLSPWRFAVADGEGASRLAEAAITSLRALGQDEGQIDKARAVWETGASVVSVIASPKPAKIPVWEQEASAACVCLGVVNAALAAGWGANWLSGPLCHDKGFLAHLGCAEGEWVPGFIHLGTPRIEPAERDRPDIAALTTWL
ncbi:MAG: nitroreductase [Pseudomonadota bacterium]